MRPSLATDQLLSWLLTYISFVVDHWWAFRSIIDIAIDSIHIGRRIFSVNHSGAQCLQPRVHRDPHACATRYLMSWHGISKHQNTAEFRRNCRAEYGIVTWRTIYSNAKWYSFRSILLGRPVYFLWTMPLGPALCLLSDSTSPSDERWHSQQHWAPAGRTADVAGACDPLAPWSNRYFKTTWKQIIH